MLELVNRYAHGYVAVPVLDACRRRGVFALLQSKVVVSADEIAASLNANSGHLLTALRLLEGLDWIVRDSDGRYRLTQQSELLPFVPPNIRELFRMRMNDYLVDQSGTGQLTEWIELSERRWFCDDAEFADLLDGVLVVPVLVAAHQTGLLGAADDDDSLLSEMHPLVQSEILRLFQGKEWSLPDVDELRLTDAGRHMVDRALVLGTTASYHSMLTQVEELVFGDAAAVMDRSDAGHEQHVDRALNVVGSGFQHDRYFRDVDSVIAEVFDGPDLAAQPRYIADIGCGDASFLRRVYQEVVNRSLRGQHLDEFPLSVIGIDFNERALIESGRTLDGIPHHLIRGDICDPQAMVAEFGRHGIDDPSQILHIRSFVDHDRPYLAPQDTTRAAARPVSETVGVFVDKAGGLIDPRMAVQSLVEHLERWASIVGPHGLVALEVHCLSSSTVKRFRDRNESLHFDAYHAFSGQHLVPADVFLMCAAEAGLFARPDAARRYPATLPYTRITLSWFEKRSYRARPATIDDVPQLVELEAECWDDGLRAPESEIRRRVTDIPGGQCVLEMDGRIRAVVYTQPIASVDDLSAVTVDDFPSVHKPEGRVVQLLGLNVHPEFQSRRLGDQLLDFALLWLGAQDDIRHVVGITRCRRFADQSLPSDEYIRQCDENGLSPDPLLRFHQSHGATVLEAVHGFRPADVANNGAGVLIQYDLRAASPGQPTAMLTLENGPANSGDDVVRSAVLRVLGPHRSDAWNPSLAFSDMGLDSLDLMELKFQLEATTSQSFGPTLFFECPTPDALSQRLSATSSEIRGSAASSNADAQRPATPASAPKSAGEKKPQSESPAACAEPIAVVGISCRFPGGVTDAESLWHLLCSGGDAIGEVPPERWDSSRYPSATRFGGFLDDVDQFDAELFRVSPREAARMDPQQRLLLELTWEALENAGIAPDTSFGPAAGIFLGLFGRDYEALLRRQLPDDSLDAYFATGSSTSVAAGRLAYYFGFEGPTLAVDTACSSSLVAVHLACQSLRNGECSLALAGGANLLLSPELSVAFSQAGMLAPDGRCKTLDAAADGYVRSEGAAMVVLKPLSDAIRDRDRIEGVIRASVINQDGASNGLTAPSVVAQKHLLRRGLELAGVEACDIACFEMHGTGTELGDPVEVEAIADVYGPSRTTEHPLTAGSIKTNLGHTEAAAGVAGLLKTILALKHQFVPPHLHYSSPNPHLPLDRVSLHIPVQGESMNGRFGAVSAFGFSGTNAHVIVEAPPSLATDELRSSDPEPAVVVLSGHTSASTEEYARRLANDLRRRTDLDPTHVAETLNTGRAHQSFRLAVIGDTHDDIAIRLEQAAAVEINPQFVGPAMLFTGQGSHYAGMGRRLFEQEPVFRAAVEECAELLREEHSAEDEAAHGLVGWLSDEAAPLDRADVAQPALFSLQYALGTLWDSWGIRPTCVLGHSIGEFAAACAAGVFDLQTAVRLIRARGRLMQSLPSNGGMLAVSGDEQLADDVCRVALERTGEPLGIAVLNGPENSVLSGSETAIESALEWLQDRDVRCIRLAVSHAFHSPLMEPMLDDFRQVARSARYSRPSIPMFSTVTGNPVVDEVCSPEYWVRQIRQPVRFADAFRRLQASGQGCILEVGPRPVLIGMAKRLTSESDVTWISSQVPGSERRCLLDALAELYCLGADIDWNAVHGPRTVPPPALPTYPFQRQRHWISNEAGRPTRHQAVDHPLLGDEICLATDDRIFESQLSARQPDWLQDHRVAGDTVMPAAGFIELALAAARRVLDDDRLVISDMSIEQPLLLDSTRTVQVVAAAHDTGSVRVTVASRNPSEDSASPWRRHMRCEARVGPRENDRSPDGPVDLETLIPNDDESIAGDDWYLRCDQAGLEYGPAFRLVTNLRVTEANAYGQIASASCPSGGVSGVSPTQLDAALQVAVAAIVGIDGGHPSSPWMPIHIGKIEAERPCADRLPLHATACVDPHGTDPKTRSVCVNVYDDAGRLVLRADDVVLRRRDPASGWSDLIYGVEWRVTSAQHAGLPVTPPAICQAVSVPRVDGGSVESLESFCRDRIRRALSEISARGLTVVARHERFFRHLQRVDDQPPINGSVVELDENTGPAATLAKRCGGRLADVLTGRRDPLELLFPNGRSDDLRRLYSDEPVFAAMNQAVGRLVAAIAARRPAAKPLRVLEIGAGTGATTETVLNHTPAGAIGEYVFTDLSTAFFDAARRRLAEHTLVQYRKLDIEHPPVDQGFEQDSFDLIVAANVLHATAELPASLAHCRQLLAPAGHLLLLEGTGQRCWVDVIFGMLDGWWRFADGDGRSDAETRWRQDHALLDVDVWQHLLAASGFENASAVTGDGNPDASLFPQAVLVAEAPKSKLIEGSWRIVSDQGGLSARLADAMRRRGATVECVDAQTLGDDIRKTVPLRGIIDLSAADGGKRAWESSLALARHMAVEFDGDRHAPQLMTVTCGAVGPDTSTEACDSAGVWGLGRAMAHEQPQWRSSRIDLDPHTSDAHVDVLLAEIQSANDDDESVSRNGLRLTPRLVRSADLNGRNLRIRMPSIGSTDDVQIERTACPENPPAGHVVVRITAAGLNFRDVLLALGHYGSTDDGTPIDSAGVECVGVVHSVGDGVTDWQAGDEVVAFGPGCFSGWLTVPHELVTTRPIGPNRTTAAGTPAVFLTAAWCLRHLAGLKRGQRILIHAATGGVGHAAVQMAKQAGAEVFATAGVRKHDHVRQMGVEHIFDSRDIRFADDAFDATGGRGFDVVLNCLSGPFAEESLRIVADGGVFIELGRGNVMSASEAARLRPDVRYEVVDMLAEAAQHPQVIGRLLRDVLAEIEAGGIAPVPTHVFGIHDAVDAFRLMQRGEHIGKLVLCWPIDEATTRPPSPKASNRPGVTGIRDDGSYLITGGLGGLGLLTAKWLVERGARHLVLAGRNVERPEAADAVESLRNTGANVRIEAVDVGDFGSLSALVGSIDPPLVGVIHAAGTLDDALLADQSSERFARVLRPKVDGAIGLHRLTSELSLDFTVYYSSIASLLGTGGQANHAAANAVLDSLAAARSRSGQPTLSINWGYWDRIGAAATESVKRRLQGRGQQLMPPEQALCALEWLFDESQWRSQTAVMSVNWPAWRAETPRRGLWSDFDDVVGRDAHDDHSSQLDTAERQREHDAVAGPVGRDIIEMDQPGRGVALRKLVRDEAATVLGMSPAAFPVAGVSAARGFFQIGMDSLTSVELRNRLQRRLTLSLPTTVAFDHPTVDRLASHLDDLLTEQVKPSQPMESQTENVTTTPTAITLEEASAELARELAELDGQPDLTTDRAT